MASERSEKWLAQYHQPINTTYFGGDVKKAYDEGFDAARADLTSPSPCGQKFADGTPHPIACWKEGIDVLYGKTDSHCLICADKEKLRAELAGIRGRWIERHITELENELAALRDRVKELEAQLGIPKSL